jgi:hypothetical protein
MLRSPIWRPTVMPTGPVDRSELGRYVGGERGGLPGPDHLHLHRLKYRRQGLDDGLVPDRLLGEDGDLRRRLVQLLADLRGHRAEHADERLAEVGAVDRGDAEPVLVALVVLLDALSELRMGGAGAEEDLLVVRGDFLHGEHRLGAEAADQEIDLVAGDDALDGVGRVRNRLVLVGVGAHQFDLHLLAADVDAARLVDVVARHFGAVPVVFALRLRHRSEHADLDRALRERERRGECQCAGKQCGAKHGIPLFGLLSR